MSPTNKAAIARAFARAAPHYQQFAEFQRQAGEQLLATLRQQTARAATAPPFVTPSLTPDHSISPAPAASVPPSAAFAPPPAVSPRAPRILDAGCGSGHFSRYWQTQGGQVTALDLCHHMLQIARQQQAACHYLQADIERLPLANEQFDLCWSNLAVQWCSQLADALRELYRVTAQGGWLAFTTLAQGSLAELHQAWQAVDGRLHGNLYPPFDSLTRASPHPAMHWRTQPVTLHYPDALSAMRAVKGIGATHLHTGRASRTLTRRQLSQLNAAWPRQQGRVTLTYQLVIGVLQRP